MSGVEDARSYALQRLAELHREYMEATKPFVDMLVRLEATRLPAPMFIRRGEPGWDWAQGLSAPQKKE